jgi:hypothetical protein
MKMPPDTRLGIYSNRENTLKRFPLRRNFVRSFVIPEGNPRFSRITRDAIWSITALLLRVLYGLVIAQTEIRTGQRSGSCGQSLAQPSALRDIGLMLQFSAHVLAPSNQSPGHWHAARARICAGFAISGKNAVFCTSERRIFHENNPCIIGIY